jgi:2-polyprenyl-6-methoxyphenol hydroxylase-like FAD-dependent oxidoreductase
MEEAVDRPTNHPARSDGKPVPVIGAGVIGPTSASCLARKGFGVTVAADRFAPRAAELKAPKLRPVR